jgi:hypothetical protein
LKEGGIKDITEYINNWTRERALQLAGNPQEYYNFIVASAKLLYGTFRFLEHGINWPGDAVPALKAR